MTDIERLTAALVGRYTIEREIGRGGMATVYLAHDVKHRRNVAVKVLRPEIAAAVGAERFLNEINVTANLHHPHILPLFDSGDVHGFLFYVMPMVEGESLRDKIDHDKQLGVEEALRIASEIAAALDYAHRKGVVHRDIKPDNILLHEGQAIVTDFGVALAVSHAGGTRLTEMGLSVGTPAYMSPEQATGDRDLDARSDIYSLGAVVYEMLAGEPPHTGPTAQAVVAKIIADPVRPVLELRQTVPAHVSKTVGAALAKVPADRPTSAAEFGAALVRAPADRRLVSWSPTMRVGVVATFAAFVVVLGLMTHWSFKLDGRSVVAPGIQENSIAVMPFVSLSDSDEGEYLGDGLAEELIDGLTSIRGLRVAPRTSSFAMAEQRADVRQVGQRLGVASVLEGSVRRSATALRVTARLSDAQEGFTLWSETFARQPDDIFEVQEEIAQAIVSALEIEFQGEQPVIITRAVDDIEAYNLFLRGRYFWNRRTREGLMTAVDYFERAVARAPRYAQAYAGLADAYAVIGFYDYLPPAEAFQRARAAAKQALEIDTALAEPHATLGYVALYYDWNWSDAEREFGRAIAMNPDYAVAHQWYANYLTARGRFDEARAANARAQALDPLSLIISAVPGWISYYARDYERAIEEFKATLQLDPNFALAHLWTGQAYEELQIIDEAVEWIGRAETLSGGSDIVVAALAHAFARAGNRDTVSTLLAHLESQSEERYVPAFEIAKIHVALGDEAKALEWLDRAYDRRSHSMAFLQVDPQLDGLRPNPAFQRLLQRVGLR